jgi:ParB family chromosome partitioning protein
MLLSVSFVPVKEITSIVPRSNFADDDINRAAELILQIEGVINPLILRSTSLESYEVVDGHLEYYAAVRAREIDLRRGEMIGAFIIESNNQEAIEEQLKLLRQPKIIDPEPRYINIEARQINTDSRITNLESRFENHFNKLQEEFRREIKKLEDRLPDQMKPLEALNTLDLAQLTIKLKPIGISSKIIQSIFDKREAEGTFKSFGDVIKRVNGLGDKTLIKIIDSFSD